MMAFFLLQESGGRILQEGSAGAVLTEGDAGNIRHGQEVVLVLTLPVNAYLRASLPLSNYLRVVLSILRS